MIRTKKVACSSCAVFAAVAVVTGVWGLHDPRLIEHDLSDEEMAVQYGRTSPDCIGCFAYEVEANCKGTNQCRLCVTTPALCASAYTWYANNNEAYKTTVDDGNNDIHLTDSRSCRRAYSCMPGMVMQMIACTDSGCDGNSLFSCRPCNKGPLEETFSKPWDDCGSCPR